MITSYVWADSENALLHLRFPRYSNFSDEYNRFDPLTCKGGFWIYVYQNSQEQTEVFWHLRSQSKNRYNGRPIFDYRFIRKGAVLT